MSLRVEHLILGKIVQWLKPEFDLEVKYQAVRQNCASVLSRSLFQKSNMIPIWPRYFRDQASVHLDLALSWPHLL